MNPLPAYRSGTSLQRQIDTTSVPDGAVAIWHLGQESVVLKGGSATVYIDPYLTDSLNPSGASPRKFESPLQPEEVLNADIVIITHDHGDHLDPSTLKGIAAASPQAKFVCPVPCVVKLSTIGIAADRIVGVNAGKAVSLGSVEITPIASKHEEFETDEDGNHAFLGYVLGIGGVTVYHAGDTVGFQALADVLKQLGVEIAMMPINGRDFVRFGRGLVGNMDFREAVELGRAIGADLLIPLHYDLFVKNTENPAYFVDYLHGSYPGQKFKMMVPGERIIYLSERE